MRISIEETNSIWSVQLSDIIGMTDIICAITGLLRQVRPDAMIEQALILVHQAIPVENVGRGWYQDGPTHVSISRAATPINLSHIERMAAMGYGMALGDNADNQYTNVEPSLHNTGRYNPNYQGDNNAQPDINPTSASDTF